MCVVGLALAIAGAATAVRGSGGEEKGGSVFEIGDIVEIKNWHPYWNGLAVVISYHDSWWRLQPILVHSSDNHAKMPGGFDEKKYSSRL